MVKSSKHGPASIFSNNLARIAEYDDSEVDILRIYGDDASERYVAARSIGPTRLSVSGLHCFRKGRMVAYESTLERDLLRKLSYDSRVLDVFEQPLTLTWRDAKGRARTYTPDLLVQWRSIGEYWEDRISPWLIEVKPREELRRYWNQWHPKFREAARQAAAKGWRFRVMDESRIRDATFGNIVTLDRYDTRGSLDALTYVLASIKRSGVTTIGETLDRLFTSPELRSAGLHGIYRLIAARLIDCDLSLPLSEQTEIWCGYDD